MTVWIVRGGLEGRFEHQFVDKSVVALAWETVPDYSRFHDREALKDWYRGFFPGAKEETIANHVGQLYAFLNTASIRDLVVLPFKNRDAVAIGEITGDYVYNPDLIIDAPHVRTVLWLRTGISRTRFDTDLRRALAARMTFSQSRVPDAERRFRMLANPPTT